ncbi:MAG: efflux RND transporter periplasmic adaptor subunit [Gammaproteobacteria bacterium]
MKPFNRLVGMTAALALLAVTMAWLAGWFGEPIRPGRFAPATLGADGPVVAVAVVEEPRFEYATGTVRARDESVVSARIVARIQAIHARAGDAVVTGQVLVELDAREQGARVEQAGQAVASARARLVAARAHHARTARLAAARAASTAELESAVAALRAAEATLAQTTEALAEARSAASYATITASMDGRVVERHAEPGDTALPGMPLLTLYDPRALRLEAAVRESLAATLAVGDVLAVHVDATGAERAAAIEEIVPSADPGSRSFVVRLALGAAQGLYPGMYGRVAIAVGSTRELRVPDAAVRRVGQLEYVVVRGAGGDERRFVRTGRIAGDGSLEVLSGLSAGEQVVLAAAP